MLGIDLLNKVVKGEITEGKYKFYTQYQAVIILEIKDKYLYNKKGENINSFLSNDGFKEFLSSNVEKVKEFKHISEENLKVLEAWANNPYKYYIYDGRYTYGKGTERDNEGFLENDKWGYGLHCDILLNGRLELKEIGKDE